MTNEAPALQLEILQVGEQLHATLPPVKAYTEQPPGVGEGKPRITQAPVPVESDTGYRWAPWGDRDDIPQRVRKAINRVPMAGVAIKKLIEMMYGNGIAYYRNSDLEQGNRIQRAYSWKVHNWLQQNSIGTKFLPAQLADYRYYMSTFCELVLSADKQTITNIFHKPAEHCRLSKQNPSNMMTEFLLYSPDFSVLTPRDENIKRLLLWHYYYDEERFFNKDLKGYKFAWHSYFPTPGMIYYPRPFWLGLFRDDGWLDVAASVPEVVNAMMRNQITIKYLVNVPETYFEVRHKDWRTYTDEQRNAHFTAVKDELNSELAGSTGGTMSIMNFFKQSANGEPIGKIEIIAIDDKIKRDSWVPSSNAADAQIVQSLGLHPSQIGLAPEGGKMGAGSGSDQRESLNAGITLNTLDQQIVLEPLNFIARFNAKTDPDWDITFYIDHTYHTTSNLMESGRVAGEGSLEVEDFAGNP